MTVDWLTLMTEVSRQAKIDDFLPYAEEANRRAVLELSRQLEMSWNRHTWLATEQQVEPVHLGNDGYFIQWVSENAEHGLTRPGAFPTNVEANLWRYWLNGAYNTRPRFTRIMRVYSQEPRVRYREASEQISLAAMLTERTRPHRPAYAIERPRSTILLNREDVFVIDYYQILEPLRPDEDPSRNLLMRNAPDVYHYSVLFQALFMFGRYEEAAAVNNYRLGLIEAMRDKDEIDQYSDFNMLNNAARVPQSALLPSSDYDGT